MFDFAFAKAFYSAHVAIEMLHYLTSPIECPAALW